MKIRTGYLFVFGLMMAVILPPNISLASISLSYVNVYSANCPSPYGTFCTAADFISSQNVYHYNGPTSASANPLPSTGAFGSSSFNKFTNLPLLRASAIAPAGSAIQSGTIAKGVQGLIWEGSTGTALPLVGDADFTISNSYTFPSNPNGWAFVSGQIAVTDDSVLSRSVAALWLDNTGYGEFTAGCGTTGALSISNFGFDSSSGPGSFSVDAGTACSGQPLTLKHGEEFFIWADLSAFGYRGGSADATNTFAVDLSPSLSEAQRAYILDNLSPVVLSAPEPDAWLLMLSGCAVAGAALRARRKAYV